MLCQVAECKLNMASYWRCFVVGILYNPLQCTIFYQRRSAGFCPCRASKLVARPQMCDTYFNINGSFLSNIYTSNAVGIHEPMTPSGKDLIF